jgi:hypothetical protein
MKKIRYFLSFSAVILFLIITAGAQDKAKLAPLAPLAPDASLADTQNWIANALKVSGNFKAGSSAYSLKSIEASGCRLSFTEAVNARRVGSANGGSPAPEFHGSLGPQVPSGERYENQSFKDGSIIPSTFYTAPARMSSNDRKVALDFNLKSAEQFGAVMPKYLYGSAESKSKVTFILLSFRDPGFPGYVIRKPGEPMPDISKNYKYSRIFLNKEDAPLVIAGFKRLVALCSTGK